MEMIDAGAGAGASAGADEHEDEHEHEDNVNRGACVYMWQCITELWSLP
jgi:hypothetical protein